MNILPQIDGNMVVWAGHDGTAQQIYKNDGSGQMLVSTGTLMNNRRPQIDGNTIVWSGWDGTANQIYKDTCLMIPLVPTLGQWGLVILGLLIGIIGVLAIKTEVDEYSTLI